jgi:hypothetical protein
MKSFWTRIKAPLADGMRALALLTLVLLIGCRHDPYAYLYDKATQARPHEQLLIKPGVSVGRIKAGMKIEDVIAAVGEPDRRSKFNLEYLRFGFSTTANRDGFVRVINCGDPCDKSSPLIKMFAGRTNGDIGMDSTRSQVIVALGQPTKAEPWGSGEERLVYTELGLDFTLAEGKVHFIAVSFPKAK